MVRVMILINTIGICGLVLAQPVTQLCEKADSPIPTCGDPVAPGKILQASSASAAGPAGDRIVENTIAGPDFIGTLLWP